MVPARRRPPRVLDVDFPKDRRIIAVSDIHGNLPFLRGLLDKLSFSPDDILVLVGDMIEKGEHSLDTLRFLMELCRTHTVYPVAGNCDDLVPEFVYGDGGGDADFFPHYFSVWPHSILRQMGAEVGVDRLEGPADYAVLRAAIREPFRGELEFLRDLPTVVRSPELLFVHGGVDDEDHPETISAWKCMKYDDFRAQQVHFRRWCVVGHWPVTLYGPDIPSAAPLFDRAQHLISIDGGCVLKLDGQLNALIIPRAGSEDFTWTAYDGRPVVTALADQAPSLRSKNIRWSEHDVEVLEKGPEFSRCRHVASGYEMDILTRYLYHPEERFTPCEDATDYCLPVTAGDRLSVVARTSRGLLCKKHGVTGWYRGPVREA
jgi:protein phosphatase